MAGAKGSTKAIRGGPPGRKNLLRLLEERVERLEQMLKVRAPDPEPSPRKGPRCPGCQLQVRQLRGRCPWCGFVFGAIRQRSRRSRSP